MRRIALLSVVALLTGAAVTGSATAKDSTCGGVQMSLVTHGIIDTPYQIVGGGTFRFRGAEGDVSWLVNPIQPASTLLGFSHTFLVHSGPLEGAAFHGVGRLAKPVPVPFPEGGWLLDPWRERIEIDSGATGELHAVGQSWLSNNHPGELELRGRICFL